MISNYPLYVYIHCLWFYFVATTAVTYRIDIRTGTGSSDGSDALDLYCDLTGTAGLVSLGMLNNPGNDFERGQVDKFTIQKSTNIGKLQCITLRCYRDDAWRFSWISIQYDGQSTFTFWNDDNVIMSSDSSEGKHYHKQCNDVPDPTREPTPRPTPRPTRVPTVPTPRPTREPTIPTHDPTPRPTDEPTYAPTPPPTDKPTAQPSFAPTIEAPICANGWYVYNPQSTEGRKCFYECNPRRRVSNQTTLLQTKTAVIKSSLSYSYQEEDSSVERRRSVWASLGSFVNFLNYAITIAGTVHSISELFRSSESIQNSKAFCTSDTVLQCVAWAKCVECGRLYNFGKDLSTIPSCAHQPYHLMEAYEFKSGCMNKACEGVVMENDRLVYECADSDFVGCIKAYMAEAAEAEEKDDCCCC